MNEPVEDIRRVPPIGPKDRLWIKFAEEVTPELVKEFADRFAENLGVDREQLIFTVGVADLVLLEDDEGQT